MGCFNSKKNMPVSTPFSAKRFFIRSKSDDIIKKHSENESETKNKPEVKHENESKENDNEDYPFPQRDYNGDRLTLQHNLFRYIWQSDFSAPVEDMLRKGASVLDVGCGTGSWLKELSKRYPQSSLSGTDYFSSFLNTVTPHGVSIFSCDIFEHLPFEDNSFDFVYMRFLACELPQKQLEEKLIHELIRVLKPGGYLEIMDIDAQGLNEGPSTQSLMSSVQSYYRSREINPFITSTLESLMSSSGQFTSINIEDRHHPLGIWKDPIGEIALLNWTIALNQIRKWVAPAIGISNDEYDKLVKKFNEEVDIFQTYWKSSRIYGKKK